MRKKIFTILLALAACVGMSWADVIPCTAADLGKVLCTDGSIYATISEASAASKTAAAVIAYVDTENAKALALALADDGGEMEWATAKTTAAAHTPAVSGGTWTLASKDDWDSMITAAGGYVALRDGFSAVGGTNMQQNAYWSSTSFSYYAWCYRFNNGSWFDDYQVGDNYVRACLAFDIPAEPQLATAYTLQLHVNDALMGSVALQDPSNDIFDFGDGTYAVPEGAEVTLLATPNEGYEFIGWKASSTICDFNDCEFVDLPTVANPLTFDMNNEVAFMAEFAAVAPQPQPAGNVVTWDMSMDAVNGIVEQNETKEVFGGITIAAGVKRAFMKNGNANALLFTFSNSQGLEGFKGFTFANTLGVNFKKIVLSGAAETFNGKESTGWVINDDKSTITWEGNAASVSIWETLNFIGPIIVNEVEFTLEGGEPTPQPAEDVDITPNVDPQHANVYYSTFFDSSVKYELPAGVEAYVADLSGANLLLSKIAEAGEVIPANVAVILKASVDPFTLTVSDADAVTFTATNDLQGSDTQIATPANCYVLAGTDGVVGFYHYTADNLNAHKAYVVYSGSNQAPRRMPFIFDQATGVENVQGDNVQSTKVIENGQLIIIRNGVRYNAAGQNVK